MKYLKNKKSHLLFFILVLGIIAWTLLLFYVGVEGIMAFLGIRNPYLFIFLVALFAGASMFTTSTFYMTLAALSISGHNPFLLGLVSGTGIVLGDIYFYYLGKEAGDLEWIKRSKLYKKMSEFIKKQPKFLVQAIVFFYTAATPLPNDIIVMLLGAAKYDFRDFIVALFLGDVFFMTLVSLLPNLFI